MHRCNMILPKIWLGVIQRYWDKKVPTNIPASSSEFSLTFSSPEVAKVVADMESNVDTENSVIKEEMIPENTFVSSYLGTYDVQGEVGAVTLLSPEKVSSTTADIIALHYNEETKEWETIEDAHIVDGYVWGTLSSFSPVAVFTVRKDSYLVEPNVAMKDCPVYVCNGNTTQIYENEDGVVFAKNMNTGVETEIPDKCIVIGGTIDGTDVSATSISVIGVKSKLRTVSAGSLYREEDKFVKVEDGKLFVKDSELYHLTGAYYKCHLENLTIKAINSKLSFITAGTAGTDTLVGKDHNGAEDADLSSNCWTKNVDIDVDGSEVECFYCGGSGYFHTTNSNVIATNSNIDYFTTGGSNGNTKNIKASLEKCNVKVFQSVNRGFIEYADADIKNCNIEQLFLCCEGADPTSGYIKGQVSVDISTGGSVCIKPGTVGTNNDPFTDVSVIKYIKVSRSTELVSDEVSKLLGDKLIIK